MQSYKDLKIWQVNQKCLKVCIKIFEKLPNNMPSRVISEQLFRSVASVGANLADGYSSYEGKEYGRYTNIALHSAVESDHWLTTLLSLFETFKEEILEATELNLESIKMLRGPMKSIEAKRGISSLSPMP